MIVVAIIGIVAAIAMPVYQNHIHRARISENRWILAHAFSGNQILIENNTPIEGLSSYPIYDRRVPLGVEDVDELYEALPSALAYFGAPPSMNIDATEHVYVALSFKKIDDIKNVVSHLLNKEPENVKVSNRVQAILRSADFDVVDKSPPIQAVRKNAITKWSWSITPKDIGVRQLTVTLFALVSINEKETPLVLNTYERTIDVEVTNIQRIWRFMKANLAWIWAPFLAIIGFLWGSLKYFFRKESNKTHSAVVTNRASTLGRILGNILARFRSG